MTVADLRAAKGKRQLTMLFTDTADEAAAAAAAGIDILSIIEPVWNPAMREAAGDCFVQVGLIYGQHCTYEDYLRAAHDPQMIIGMCEDYRAAASIDLEHDRISRAQGSKVRCPILVLWGAKGKIGGWYDPIALWREYCTEDVRGGSVDSGHYLAEEAPEEVLRHLKSFLT